MTVTTHDMLNRSFPATGWLHCLDCNRSWQESWLGPSCICGREGAQVPTLGPLGEAVPPPPNDPEDRRPLFLRLLRPLRKPTGSPYRSTGVLVTGTVQARVHGLLRWLNNAQPGSRNADLYWVSCRAGEMLATGELTDQHQVADALTQVALGTGLTIRETRGTIRSGFRTSGVVL